MLAVVLVLFHVFTVYSVSIMLLLDAVLHGDWVVAALAWMFNSLLTICLLWRYAGGEE